MTNLENQEIDQRLNKVENLDSKQDFSSYEKDYGYSTEQVKKVQEFSDQIVGKNVGLQKEINDVIGNMLKLYKGKKDDLIDGLPIIDKVLTSKIQGKTYEEALNIKKDFLDKPNLPTLFITSIDTNLRNKSIQKVGETEKEAITTEKEAITTEKEAITTEKEVGIGEHVVQRTKEEIQEDRNTLNNNYTNLLRQNENIKESDFDLTPEFKDYERDLVDGLDESFISDYGNDLIDDKGNIIVMSKFLDQFVQYKYILERILVPQYEKLSPKDKKELELQVATFNDFSEKLGITDTIMIPGLEKKHDPTTATFTEMDKKSSLEMATINPDIAKFTQEGYKDDPRKTAEERANLEKDLDIQDKDISLGKLYPKRVPQALDKGFSQIKIADEDKQVFDTNGAVDTEKFQKHFNEKIGKITGINDQVQNFLLEDKNDGGLMKIDIGKLKGYYNSLPESQRPDLNVIQDQINGLNQSMINIQKLGKAIQEGGKKEAKNQIVNSSDKIIREKAMEKSFRYISSFFDNVLQDNLDGNNTKNMKDIVSVDLKNGVKFDGKEMTITCKFQGQNVTFFYNVNTGNIQVQNKIYKTNGGQSYAVSDIGQRQDLPLYTKTLKENMNDVRGDVVKGVKDNFKEGNFKNIEEFNLNIKKGVDTRKGLGDDVFSKTVTEDATQRQLVKGNLENKLGTFKNLKPPMKGKDSSEAGSDYFTFLRIATDTIDYPLANSDNVQKFGKNMDRFFKLLASNEKGNNAYQLFNDQFKEVLPIGKDDNLLMKRISDLMKTMTYEKPGTPEDFVVDNNKFLAFLNNAELGNGKLNTDLSKGIVYQPIIPRSYELEELVDPAPKEADQMIADLNKPTILEENIKSQVV